MSLKKTLAMLILGVAIAAGGTVLARQVFAVAVATDPDALHHAILDYIAERNPRAPMDALQGFPEALLAEADRSDIDHCLALAQAEVESEFRPDAVGRSGEIGLFQMLPSTAAWLEPLVGKFRRPAPERRDLGDLADPVVSTRFAMAYLRDIRTRKPAMKDALTEYNAGPGQASRHRHYYGRVMGTYVEILERSELRCRLAGNVRGTAMAPTAQRRGKPVALLENPAGS